MAQPQTKLCQDTFGFVLLAVQATYSIWQWRRSESEWVDDFGIPFVHFTDSQRTEWGVSITVGYVRSHFDTLINHFSSSEGSLQADRGIMVFPYFEISWMKLYPKKDSHLF